jgi:lipopolysaccharide export system permease protein
MTLLMKYLLREHLRVFATCLGGLAVVYLVVDFVEKIRRFVGYQADPRHILWYFVLKCPGILFQITPLAVLMSTLLTVAILSRNNEITAMRSSGISLYWVSVPFLVMAQALSLLMLWASDAVIPGANQQAEALREIKIEKRNPRAVFQANEIWVRLGNQAFMRGDLPDDNAPRIYGVSLYRLEQDFTVRELVSARELQYENGGWVLLSGISRTFQGDQGVRSESFDRLSLQLNQKPEDFRRAIRIDSDALSLRELSAYVERLREDGYNPARYATDLFGRTAFPFVCLIMALIGLTMSLMETGSRRTGLVRGVGYSLLVGFLYWSSHSVALALGRSSVLPPLLAGWTANILFLCFAGYLFLRVRQ